MLREGGLNPKLMFFIYSVCALYICVGVYIKRDFFWIAWVQSFDRNHVITSEVAINIGEHNIRFANVKAVTDNFLHGYYNHRVFASISIHFNPFDHQ